MVPPKTKNPFPLKDCIGWKAGPSFWNLTPFLKDMFVCFRRCFSDHCGVVSHAGEDGASSSPQGINPFDLNWDPLQPSVGDGPWTFPGSRTWSSGWNRTDVGGEISKTSRHFFVAPIFHPAQWPGWQFIEGMNDEILPCKFHGYSEMSWWKLISSRLVVCGSYIDFQLHFKWVAFHGYFSEVCERNKPYLRKWSTLTCVTIQDGPLPVLIKVITPLIEVLTAVTWL